MEAPTRGRERSPLGDVAMGFLRQREASIVVVAIGLIVFFRLTNEHFSDVSNISTLADFTAATAIIAVGEVMLLILGEIDLSVGNVYALAPFVMYFAWNYYMPLWVGVILALGVSALIGLVNGLVTVALRVPSFVTTLGMLFLLNGVTLTISNSTQVATPTQPGFTWVMGKAPYAEIIWAVGIVAVMTIVLNWTRFGLHTFAVGGNSVGAAEAGVRVGRIKVANFVLTAVLAGFTGIIEAVRVGSTDPTAGGTEIMFYAVASAVIGGTALAGGSGTVIGAFLGAIVLSVLKDGLNLNSVSAVTYFIILGAAILLAMTANVYLGRLRRAGKT